MLYYVNSKILAGIMIKFDHAEKNKIAPCTMLNCNDYALRFTGILD